MYHLPFWIGDTSYIKELILSSSDYLIAEKFTILAHEYRGPLYHFLSF